MFHNLRRMSPFTIFWILFYVAACIGLLVPWDIGQWFAMALATPFFLVTATLCILLAGAIAWGAWAKCVQLLKRKAHEGA
ncbi:hypothetical protein DN824_09600 [Stutzerimonas nosocomialis]|uniref:hypothetical protein n=1 Tax=Stutzerimonas nosocomialis TaxID=1056496 RepID=UPI00126B09E7|nr:hypothetical protein [Stutzerimonas nosocomialis]TLX58324.1 hypothetical protein DN824_09600 [Stutzerimonas nosocomialis]